ncbi:MAG: hypothetical protein HKP14_10820 [Bacteroidia bacterium]|nr:hypothetical protein [Bacteroidia bacterium]
MIQAKAPKITVSIDIQGEINQIWHCWITPEHIINWYYASDDWHCPRATNNFEEGGTFSTRMAAKDGSFGFDFEGIYSKIEEHKSISYILEDDREVTIHFDYKDGTTTITQTFDAEDENPLEMQENGWEAILLNYKIYTEDLLSQTGL